MAAAGRRRLQHRRGRRRAAPARRTPTPSPATCGRRSCGGARASRSGWSSATRRAGPGGSGRPTSRSASAGVRLVDDLRGGHDADGRPLSVTERVRRRRDRRGRRPGQGQGLAACRSPSSAGWRRRSTPGDAAPGARVAGADRTVRLVRLRPGRGRPRGPRASRPGTDLAARGRHPVGPAGAARPPGSSGRGGSPCWASSGVTAPAPARTASRWTATTRSPSASPPPGWRSPCTERACPPPSASAGARAAGVTRPGRAGLTGFRPGASRTPRGPGPRAGRRPASREGPRRQVRRAGSQAAVGRLRR